MTPEITSLERFRSHLCKLDTLISVGCKFFSKTPDVPHNGIGGKKSLPGFFYYSGAE